MRKSSKKKNEKTGDVSKKILPLLSAADYKGGGRKGSSHSIANIQFARPGGSMGVKQL